MKNILRERMDFFESKMKEWGIEHFPISLEFVPEEVMEDVITYSGLVSRPRHWHYGQSYDHQKMNNEMGLSKIYEIIVNGNPATAYLLDTNTDMANTLVLAHILGHSTVFMNNYLFQDTDRKMMEHSAERASRVDEYINKYGIEIVERTMDIGFALEKHIDWDKGYYRSLYSPTEKILKKRIVNEFEDLTSNKDKPIYQTILKNASFPPRPEKDLLWFIINYGKLEPWQKDVLEIIRAESFYFYPQYYTKIIHEGLSSWIQGKLIRELPDSLLTPAEFIEFAKIHEKVVQPGGNKLNINPYFLGFSIFDNLEKQYDELFENGLSDITGFQKVLEVARNEDDISLIRNYLTQELCDELKMFAFVKRFDKKREEYIQIESTNVIDIIEHLISGMYDYRTPVISIVHATQMGLELEHENVNVGYLDLTHLRKVMQYLFEVWNGIIDLKTKNRRGEVIHYTYDEEGFSHSEKDE